MRKAAGIVIYLLMGVVQAIAFFSALRAFFGLEGFLGSLISIILSLIVSEIPIIGQICGIVGAVKGWGWPWWGGALAFIVAL